MRFIGAGLGLLGLVVALGILSALVRTQPSGEIVEDQAQEVVVVSEILSVASELRVLEMTGALDPASAAEASAGTGVQVRSSGSQWVLSKEAGAGVCRLVLGEREVTC